MRVGLSVVTMVAAASLAGATPASADGAGYGGNAGQLSVTWVKPTGAVAAPYVPADTGPSQDPERVGVVDVGPTLTIVGLGFRQKTVINVQVGEVANLQPKTDVTGTLSVTVPVNTSEAVPTGASVLASGLSPSGTTRTLIGSVPPKPSGLAPSTFVPWFAAAFAAVGAVVLVRRVRRTSGSAGADGSGVDSLQETGA